MNDARRHLVLIVLAFVGVFACADSAFAQPIAVGALTYAEGAQTSECFAPRFLKLTSFETTIDTEPEFTEVDLATGAIYDHPFIVMSGAGAFSLPPREVERLRMWLLKGGFLLATASCSDRAWDESFRALARELFSSIELGEIDPAHDVFHMVFDVSSPTTIKQRPARLFELSLDGRLAILYSPDGLSDADSLGPECCCCGRDEIRDARLLCVNALAYAVVR